MRGEQTGREVRNILLRNGNHDEIHSLGGALATYYTAENADFDADGVRRGLQAGRC